MDLDKINLFGRLTADPTARGSATLLRVATNRVVKAVQQTEYHTVVMFGKLGQVAAKYLKKGDRVFQDGRVQTTERIAEDGRRFKPVEVIGENLIMLGATKKLQAGHDDVLIDESEIGGEG